MAYIGHPCTRCTHSDLWRNDRRGTLASTCGAPTCGCTCSSGPSQVLPTWGIDCQPITRIVKPGDKLGLDEASASLPTCGCKRCKALYEQLGGVAA